MSIRDSLPIAFSAGIATLDFCGDDAQERYNLLLVTTLRLAFAERGVRRVEVAIAASDNSRRRALHRAGFRLEGVARERLLTPDGPTDQLSYALLSTDVTAGRSGFTAVMNSVTARKRVIAHLLLTDEAGRVCVLETSFKPDFELPGGILEIGESPRQGLLREVLEELDHRISINRLLVVDWLAPYLGWEDAVELIFDGGVMPDRSKPLLRPDLREIRAVFWLEPADAADRMAEYARGRLLAAVQARVEGRTLYLEAGERIS